MKTLNNLLLFILSISLSVLTFTELKAQTSGSNPISGQAGLHIKIRGGTPNTNPPHPCYGSGYCGPCGGLCVIISSAEFASAPAVLAGEAVVDFTVLDASHIRIDFNQAPDDISGVINISAALVAPPDVAQGLGQNAITILPGTYPLDFTASRYGSIVVNAVITEF